MIFMCACVCVCVDVFISTRTKYVVLAAKARQYLMINFQADLPKRMFSHVNRAN